jgi:FkbM family methyltransferase
MGGVQYFFDHLNKPEYWFRPRQLFKRIGRKFRLGPSEKSNIVGTPWGTELTVKPNDIIGESLLNHGVFELAVSETLWRLTDPGDWCLDVGANIGYMTGLLAARASRSGECFGYEPHPKIFPCLKTNMAKGLLHRDNGFANVSLFQVAAGGSNGDVELIEPAGFNNNEGIARLADGATAVGKGGKRYRVTMQTLDSQFSRGERFGVMKIDVEGAEPDVLEGAKRLLANGQIRDIVYEDFQPFPSNCARFLMHHDYKVYRISKTPWRPRIWHPSNLKMQKNTLPWESTNYLATLDPVRAEARLRQRGWLCLGGT